MNPAATEPFVFHIEDNDGDAYLVVKALSTSGHRMQIGRSVDGRDAKATFERVAAGETAAPSLVLLDLKLPFVSGLEILQYMRTEQTLQSVPVVVFTSSDEQRDVEAARAAGCDDYYVKPIDYNVFRTTLKEICNKYLTVAPKDSSEKVTATTSA